MTKIFITGATGHIGSYLVNELLAREHTLHLLVRSLTKARRLESKNVLIFQGDVTDKEKVKQAMAGCDQVYHLAALTKIRARDPAEYFSINIGGTLNVLEAAAENNVKKVVVTSTAGIYGPSITGSISEEKIRETDFFSEYECSKALSVLKIKEFVLEKGLDAVIVCPTRVYGPELHGSDNSTNLLFERFLFHSWRILPGKGKEIGNYAYIGDVVKGHILAMEKGKKGHSYIFGGENCSYSDFFNLMGELSGIKRKMIRLPVFLQFAFAYLQLWKAMIFKSDPLITPKWVYKGIFNWEVVTHKAEQELGYTITPLREGMLKTIEYFKERKHVTLPGS